MEFQPSILATHTAQVMGAEISSPRQLNVQTPNLELFFFAPLSQTDSSFPLLGVCFYTRHTSTCFLSLLLYYRLKLFLTFFEHMLCSLFCIIWLKLSSSVALLGLSWWVTGASCQNCWCAIHRKVGRFFSGCLLLFSNSWNHIWEMLNSQRR